MNSFTGISQRSYLDFKNIALSHPMSPHVLTQGSSIKFWRVHQCSQHLWETLVWLNVPGFSKNAYECTIMLQRCTKDFFLRHHTLVHISTWTRRKFRTQVHYRVLSNVWVKHYLRQWSTFGGWVCFFCSNKKLSMGSRITKINIGGLLL